jgi:hypothetical protein
MGCRRVNMVEYYALIYENGKMRPVETIPGMEGEGKRRMMDEVNSTTIHCKTFCKCQNVLPVKQ